MSNAADATEIISQSGADAVMVGRASYGAPWTAGLIAGTAAGSEAPGVPMTGAEMAAYVVAHYVDMLALYGVESGLRQARKHLGWYLDRYAPCTPAALRSAIMTSLEPDTVIAIVRQAFDAADLSERRAA